MDYHQIWERPQSTISFVKGWWMVGILGIVVGQEGFEHLKNKHNAELQRADPGTKDTG